MDESEREANVGKSLKVLQFHYLIGIAHENWEGRMRGGDDGVWGN